jgi:hypothetical protein
MKWSLLQHPAVALIELVASAIAVVQSVPWLYRYISTFDGFAASRQESVKPAKALFRHMMSPPVARSYEGHTWLSQ